MAANYVFGRRERKEVVFDRNQLPCVVDGRYACEMLAWPHRVSWNFHIYFSDGVRSDY